MPATFPDPKDWPAPTIDCHLPAVDVQALQAKALRQRFRSPPAWFPEIKIERSLPGRLLTASSVLIPLVQRDNGLTVLLTQRAEHLTVHPGQISFPGGRAELEDLDAVATALREASEEIGLVADQVEVLGQLPAYVTSSAYIVTPIVALVRPKFNVRLDPLEVADIFEVPLAFLMDPANHRWHALETETGRREFLSMQWEPSKLALPSRPCVVWGATAAMLRNLYRFLSA